MTDVITKLHRVKRLSKFWEMSYTKKIKSWVTCTYHKITSTHYFWSGFQSAGQGAVLKRFEKFNSYNINFHNEIVDKSLPCINC